MNHAGRKEYKKINEKRIRLSIAVKNNIS